MVQMVQQCTMALSQIFFRNTKSTTFAITLTLTNFGPKQQLISMVRTSIHSYIIIAELLYFLFLSRCSITPPALEERSGN